MIIDLCRSGCRQNYRVTILLPFLPYQTPSLIGASVVPEDFMIYINLFSNADRETVVREEGIKSQIPGTDKLTILQIASTSRSNFLLQ